MTLRLPGVLLVGVLFFGPPPIPAAGGEGRAGVDLGALLRDVARKPHPRLLFHDLSSTPGFRSRDKEPFATFFGNIERAAKERKPIVNVIRGLSTGAMQHAGGRAHEGEVLFDPSLPGFMFRATGKREWLDAAIAELKNLKPVRGTDDATGESEVLGRFLLRYSLLFDWVEPELDAKTRPGIVRALSAYADEVYREYAASRNPHRRVMLGSGLGVASLALAGENGNTSSRPLDWLRTATVCLAVEDSVKWAPVLTEAGERGALGGMCNAGGYCRIGGYRSYWSGLLARWLRVYASATGRNPLVDFPAFRRVVTEPLWSSLPNAMDGVQNTRRGGYWQCLIILHDLLGESERAAFDRYTSIDERVYPDWRRYAFGEVWNDVFWLLFYPAKEAGRPREPAPAGPGSFFARAGEVCVLRGSGAPGDAENWLTLCILNEPMGSHRDMLHNDNLSFQTFMDGDYLMCDSGEVKTRMRGYGPQFATGHNTLLVDGRGPVKEDVADYYRFVNPARAITWLTVPGASLVSADMTIARVEVDPTQASVTKDGKDVNSIPLDPPVKWTRTILFPFDSYFVVADEVESGAAREFALLLHLSSLGIRPAEAGRARRVNGTLAIGGEEVDWGAGEELSATKQWTGVWKRPGAAVRVDWRTAFPREPGPRLAIDSFPAAEVIEVCRGWGSIPQVGPPEKDGGEVDHPFLRIASRGKALRRVTILSAERGEFRCRAVDLAGGTAVEREGGGTRDLVILSAGRAECGDVEAAGRIAFLRRDRTGVTGAILVDGTRISMGGRAVVATSRPVASLVMTRSAAGTTVCYNAPDSFTLTLPGPVRGATIEELPADSLLVLEDAWKPEVRTLRAEGDRIACPAGRHRLVAR